MKRTDPFSREYINKVLTQGMTGMIQGWDEFTPTCWEDVEWLTQTPVLEADFPKHNVTYKQWLDGKWVVCNNEFYKHKGETEPMLFSDEVKKEEKKEVSKAEELYEKLNNAEYLTKDGKLLVEVCWGSELKIAKNPLRYDEDQDIVLNKDTIEELSELQSFLKQHKGSSDAARSERMANRYAESILGDK